MKLKVYADRLSQPSRATLIFCKANGIEFEEVKIAIAKQEQKSPEYAEINPMKQVPAIVHGDFKLNESHAILVYLASTFPEVAEHWYPTDIQKRAKIHSILDWHHSNLRPGSVGFIFNTIIAVAFRQPLNPSAAAGGEKLLSASLETIESLWLQGDGPFLLGSSQPSIADLALICEIMQLQFAEESDCERILGPHPKISKWIEDVRNATAPHFDEVHSGIGPVKEMLYKLKEQQKAQH